VSHPFCGHCSRIRITSDGKIRTCLFSVWDHDLHAQMQRGASDEELADFIRGVIQKKKSATTSASRISCTRQGRWCISGDDVRTGQYRDVGD
ncbi:MAG: hypothetical protein WBW91_16980, partial [Candidatus Sulfotelmatobacter sp.]